MDEENDIYEGLHLRVTSGGLTPNTKLKPAVLRHDYNCSASTIREALFRLSTVGLVSFQEQRGFRVPIPTDQAQHELTHLRILLECEGACLSLRQGGIDWESQLTAAHHKLSHIEKRVRGSADHTPLFILWAKAEQAFHETLISDCGSDVLKATHAMIYQRFRQQVFNSDKKFVFVAENIEQHQGILEAALMRDEALIRSCIYSHLERNLVFDMPPELPKLPY